MAFGALAAKDSWSLAEVRAPAGPGLRSDDAREARNLKLLK